MQRQRMMVMQWAFSASYTRTAQIMTFALNHDARVGTVCRNNKMIHRGPIFMLYNAAPMRPPSNLAFRRHLAFLYQHYHRVPFFWSLPLKTCQKNYGHGDA